MLAAAQMRRTLALDIEELIAGTVESRAHETERADGILMLVRDGAEVTGEPAADTDRHISPCLLQCH